MIEEVTRARSGSIAKLAGAMAISGSIGWFVVISDQPVLQVVFWRCVIGGVALLAVCLRLQAFKARISRRSWALMLFSGIAMVSNWLLLFAAYTHVSISTATAAYHMQPFILVFLGALTLGERLTGAHVGWLALAFGGLLLILDPGDVARSSGHGVGLLLALGAAGCWAVAALAAKRLAGIPPHLIAFMHVTVGAVLLAPAIDFAHLPHGSRAWSALLVIGVVHTGFVYVLMYGAIQKLPTPVQGALSYMNPVVAFGIDALAFGQRLQASQWLGVAAILAAAAGVNGLLSVRWRRLEAPQH